MRPFQIRRLAKRGEEMLTVARVTARFSGKVTGEEQPDIELRRGYSGS
jgi:hypothetical protein